MVSSAPHVEDGEFLHPLFPRAHRGGARPQAGGEDGAGVLGFGGKIPVVGDFERGLAQGKARPLY